MSAKLNDHARADELWRSIQQLVVRTLACLPLGPSTSTNADKGTQSAAKASRKDHGAPARQHLPVDNSGTSAFELFGFDIMPDEDLRPWLLEVGSVVSSNALYPLCSSMVYLFRLIANLV